MHLLGLRWNEAMARHQGKFKPVAAEIAAQIAVNPELRNEAAGIVTIFFLQAGLDVHSDAFKAETGKHLGHSYSYTIIPKAS
jgi:hypothetical protein